MRCATGRVPEVTLTSNSRFISTATCTAYSIPNDCSEIIRVGGTTYCTECDKDFYLLLSSAGSTYGSCQAKEDWSNSGISKLELYVYGYGYSSPSATLNPYGFIVGLNSFKELTGAIIKAEDYCARYKTCEVVIHLMKGTHLMLRSKSDADSIMYQRT